MDAKLKMKPMMNIVIMQSDRTSISVSRETRDRLAKFGCAGESFETVLNRVLDIAEKFRDTK